MRAYLIICLLLNFIISFGCDSERDSLICRLPFDIIKNQIIIKIQANLSDTLYFIFDTGNENAHMDSTTAAKLNLKPLKFQEVHCSGGESLIPVVVCDYKIGNLEINNIETTTGQLSNYSRIMKRRIDGIIGQDIMKDHIIRLNFDRKVLEIFNNKFIYKGMGEAHKIVSRGPTINATVTLQNEQIISGEFIIDSGSNSSLTLNSSYTDTSKLNELIGEYKTYNSYDMCGNAQVEFEGKAQNLWIGTSQTNMIPITLSMVKTGVLADKKYAGLIGTPVLRCFTIILDSYNNIMYFEPNEALKDFSKNTKH